MFNFMKLVSLFCDFHPRLKCGADPVTATALAGFNVLSGVKAADQSKENVLMQLDAQSRENQLNRDWQTEQAEVARQWQAGQTLQQNQFQEQLSSQQQQYNLQSMAQQAKYNSPVYMAQQLRTAGINPQVYFGNHGSFQGSSAQAGGSPSALSPGPSTGVGSVSGLSPVGFQPFDLHVPQLMTAVGSMFKGLADAKKSGVETSFLEQSFEKRLQQVFAAGDMAQIDKALKELDLKFKSANLPLKFKQAYADYKETLQRIDLLREQSLTEREEQSLKRATAGMNKALQELHEKDKERLGLTIQFLPRLLESEILSNRGAAAAGFGKAQESKANAAVLREEQRIRKVAANIREKGETKEMQSVLDELNAKQAVSQEQYKQASLSIKKLNAIIDTYGSDAGRAEFDAELQNFFNIIGLRTSIHN